jgi:serine/threonine-protein kinase
MELRSLGRYRLIRALPVVGTTCRIWTARHEDQPDGDPPGHLVKLLMPHDDGQAQLEAQFVHEARLMRVLNHPGIPTLHAEGSQDGVRYLVMDYVDGVDLATLLGHDGDEPVALNKELAVYIVGQLADALRHVHTLERELEDGSIEPLDALHRDLCPANVLLSRDGDVLLADFGSATSRLLAAQHLAPQAGTKAYMAPERVIGTGAASPQTDLFALAVMLWEMLRGERCFRAETDLKTMDAIVRFDISHAHRRVHGLSPKLGEVLRRNLDRDPARRYTSAFQVLQRLAQSPEAKAAETSRLELASLVVQAASRRERSREATA